MKYETFRQAIIDRIKELSRERNLSINKLYKISHISNSTISRFFNDPNASIMIDTLKKLCIGLGIDIDVFLIHLILNNL